MAAALSDAQLQAVEQAISANPQILKAFDEYHQWQQARGRLAYAQKGGPPTPKEVLKQYGINFPDLEDYQIQVDPNGHVHLDRQNWFQRNADWVLPVATIGGGAAISAAAGGGGAAGTAASTTPTYTSPAAAEAGLSGGLVAPATGTAAGTTAATTAGAAAPAIKAATSSSLLHDLLPTIIGAGATLGGTAIGAHANTEAAKIAAEQADKALALQKEQYALQRQDTAPYRALGQGAVGNLGYLGGIDVQSKVPELESTVPKSPYGTLMPQGAPTLNSGGTNTGIATQQSSVLVPVKNPATGLVHLVPNNEVSNAIAAGGQVTR